MSEKIRKVLDFPYPPEYEAGFTQNLMKSMHKPLLLAVTATLLFVTWILGICIFWPDSIAPRRYINGLITIHFVFMVFTIIVLLASVGLRRQLFQYPKLHVMICNLYAVGVCLWASVLSAYADYSAAVYTAYIAVTLCVSMVSMFKPWLAMVAFIGNYMVYFILSGLFAGGSRDISHLYTAALASLLGIVIASAFYRFRARTYYDRQIIAQQLDEINQINRQLQILIHMDNLTGLYNRRFYAEVLPERLRALDAAGGYCCMMFDVDYFKAYNDHYGHPAGDECLRTVARLIRDTVPHENAYTLRYGGEEFFVLAAIPSLADAQALAGSIFHGAEMANLSHAASPFGKVTLSCGLVFCPKGSRWNLHQLTQCADDALYRSKQNGRNQISLYAD